MLSMRKLGLGLLSVAVSAPFLYMVSVSLMGESELLRWPPPLLPQKPTFGNYAAALAALPYAKVFLNTAPDITLVAVVPVSTSW